MLVRLLLVVVGLVGVAAVCDPSSHGCRGGVCKPCTEWVEDPSSFAHLGDVSSIPGCQSCAPCSAYGTDACSDVGCHSCGSRIVWVHSNWGYAMDKAREAVAREFPSVCGGCAPQNSGALCPDMTWHCEGSDCRTCSQWAEAESSPVFLQRGHVSRRKGCESCTPCAAYNTEACAGSECYSCGSRIAWLVGTGKSLTEARDTVANEFPSTCGSCAATPRVTGPCPASATHCEGGECLSCNVWLSRLSGSEQFLLQGKVSALAGCEECAPCPAYRTAACSVKGECYSCGSRIEWLVSKGSELDAARNQVSREFAECRGCAAETTEYAQVWSDEFFGSVVEPTRWGYDLGAGGWGNQEWQRYTTHSAVVNGGHLTIKAERRNGEFESARLVSRGKATWRSGRFEIRAKLPVARGSWPALWMLPEAWKFGGWPQSGEIDIMEHVGYEVGAVHHSLHTDAENHMKGTQFTHCAGVGLTVAKCGTTIAGEGVHGFHTYGLEWGENSFVWTIDGIPTASRTLPANDWRVNPFVEPFHLLLNVAVGGSWGGLHGVDEAAFPDAMVVDWVRVSKSMTDVARSSLGKTVAMNGRNMLQAWNVVFSRFPRFLKDAVAFVSNENHIKAGTLVDFTCPSDVKGCDFYLAHHYCPSCSDTGFQNNLRARGWEQSFCAPVFNVAGSQYNMVSYKKSARAGERVQLPTLTSSIMYMVGFAVENPPVCGSLSVSDCTKSLECTISGGSCVSNWCNAAPPPVDHCICNP